MVLVSFGLVSVWPRPVVGPPLHFLLMRNSFFYPLIAVLLSAGIGPISAQDNVGIGTITPDPSALVEIQASDKGLLIPRTDTLAIVNPATGLLIYTPTDSSFWYFDGILWRRGIGPAGPEGPSVPGLQGQTLRYDTVFFNDWVANSFIWNNEFHVGVNTDQPDSSAVMHLVSENKGFLPPRMTETMRDAINDPAEGLIIFNTTDSTLDYFNGTCWLASYQENCDDCHLTVTPSSLAETIDRVVSPSTQITLDLVQVNGLPQQVAINITSALPPGVTADITPNPAPSTGLVDIVFTATPFAPDGTFPVVIQVLCGPSTYNIIFSLTILPCYHVPVNNSAQDYDLGTEFYALYPLAPTNSPVCVVCDVATGVLIEGTSSTTPAFSTGTLPAGSLVAIVNDGNIIGRGGDGGDGYDPAQGLTGDGEDGGTAIDLTLDADIVNNFNIYGGGGGGGSMAFSISTGNLTSPPLPPLSIGFFIGSGGGGGAGNGEGGTLPQNLIGLAFYEPGIDGTGGQFGVEGQGGVYNLPITIPISIFQVIINPNTIGGNGGPYGYPGTQGSFQLTLTACADIPFIGLICTPPINIPIPVPPPLAGNGGYAVKRNGFTTNIPDNLYNTSFLKGAVGP